MTRFFVIPDIHGELEKLNRALTIIADKAGFALSDGDELVQLGDKCDRGPDSYGVIERFRQLKLTHPDQVHMLWGNHEDMFWEAAKIPLTGARQGHWDLFSMNGGGQTLRSYGRRSGDFSKEGLRRAVGSTGHAAFFEEHVLFYETEDYFFCHAPIGKVHPQTGYRGVIPPQGDFREHKHYLIWNYEGEATQRWVDPDAVPGKICVYGHIHGLRENTGTGEVEIPTVRHYRGTTGSAVLLDTGCGCYSKAPLSVLELPALTVYTSDGDTYSIA